MSDKSVWSGLGNLMGGRKGSKQSAKALTTMEQRCPVCQNALDPRWSKCPYCEASKNAGNRSSRVVPDPEPEPTRAVGGGGGGRPATRVDVGAAPPPPSRGAAAGAGAAMVQPGGSRGRTIVDAAPDGVLGVERHVGGGRRITGIVVSFTWSRLGQLFEVRDGRNYAGSGVVSADNNSPCEILMAEDRTMSSAHFLILCQGGKYIISDNFSTNGTFVNDEQIDTRGVELADNSVIKAGATVFSFQKIRALAGASTEPVRERDPEPDPDVQPKWRPGGREDTVI